MYSFLLDECEKTSNQNIIYSFLIEWMWKNIQSEHHIQLSDWMNVEYEYKTPTLKFNDRETWKRVKKFLHKNNNKNFKEYK
jgi:hypothetical protein